MKQVIPVFKREFLGYFRSPIAYVILAVFALMATGLAIFLGDLLRGNVASLAQFFVFIPWLLMIFGPAIAMRLWAEERRSGTIELIFTLPVTTTEAVIGKFLAAWAFTAIAILLTLPLAFTVEYLGNPDWGVIVTSYLGSLLMAAGYLGISSLTSALTRNQVVAFVIALVVCVVLTLIGWSVASNLLQTILPVGLVDALSNFSFITHFDSMTRGLIDLRSIVFFISVTLFSLLVNVIVLER